MPRARKKPSTVSQPVATEVKAPDVIISRQQYIEDIKVRWQITSMSGINSGKTLIWYMNT